jgi:hypothetical protein
MKKFRLPRKTKKKMYKYGYFYPMDPIEKTYQMAFPRENQEDYDAYKQGILTNLLDDIKRLAKEYKNNEKNN